MELTKEQALNNLAQVCAVYKGTLEEHKVLQESLKLLAEAIKEEKKEEAQ
jgi:hypothetical protein